MAGLALGLVPIVSGGQDKLTMPSQCIPEIGPRIHLCREVFEIGGVTPLARLKSPRGDIESDPMAFFTLIDADLGLGPVIPTCQVGIGSFMTKTAVIALCDPFCGGEADAMTALCGTGGKGMGVDVVPMTLGLSLVSFPSFKVGVGEVTHGGKTGFL